MIIWRPSLRSLIRRHIHSRAYKEDPRWPGWEVVVGIEVHAQIKSRNKLFSDALTSGLGERPNTHVSPFDAAFPGTLPKLNMRCVELALRTAIALNSTIPLRSSFDRKHYFYSDLPLGYQITQRYAPLALGGQLSLPTEGIAVRIGQIQLEQDTAKSTFDSRRHLSNIDLNRAGTGLMEIVSEPDMRSPEEAVSYVKTLQTLLRSVGSSDGNMEQGSLRCDVNVSVNRPGGRPGTRCEIKNLNSVKFIMIAITSEVQRQTALLENDLYRPIPQETRGFSEERAETFKLRSKEDAPDYRYMPDPNIPPLLLTEDYIAHIRATMPELPPATRARLHFQYGLSFRDVDVLMAVDSGREVRFDGEVPGDGEGGAIAHFDRLCTEGSKGRKRDPKVVVNWMTHELLGELAARTATFRDIRLSVDQMGELIDLVSDGIITGSSRKILLRYMLDHPSDTMPSRTAQELGLVAMDSSLGSELDTLCLEAIASLPDEVAAVRRGSKNVVNKIVGRVMKTSRGRANAQSVKAMIEKIILDSKEP